VTDVFISYARSDQPIAEKLQDLLTGEGWDVWFDTDIYAGAEWERLLLKTLSEARAVIVLWTARSVLSKWVTREARLAADSQKLVPVMLEPCEVPSRLAQLEAAQLLGWNGGPHPEVEVLFAGLGRLARPSRIDTVRPGFETDFLGPDVGLPSITGVGEELPYLHFSVIMNPARRLAWYVAYNMAHPLHRPERERDVWTPDPFLPRAFQPLNEHYERSPLDRGHLVRPPAVSWGEDRLAAIARRQSFFFTNSAPRPREINRPWWRAFAEWEGRVVRDRGRAIGFSGPILRDDDPLYRDISQTIGRLVAHQTFRIPRAYWNVVVAPDPDGKLSLAAFLLLTPMLVPDPDGELLPAPFLLKEPALSPPIAPKRPGARAYDPEQYLTSLDMIETETGISFSAVLHEAAATPLRR
jgi:endonuclease G